MTPHDLKIRSIQTMLVNVPMRRALGTSAMRIDHAPLLLVDLITEEGLVGHAYLFCYLQSAGIAAHALFQDAAEVLAGKAAAPAEVRRLLEGGFRLIGARGLVSMVMAGIDIACWDVLAKAATLPLATMLGAALRPIPAYNSNGLRVWTAFRKLMELRTLCFLRTCKVMSPQDVPFKNQRLSEILRQGVFSRIPWATKVWFGRIRLGVLVGWGFLWVHHDTGNAFTVTKNYLQVLCALLFKADNVRLVVTNVMKKFVPHLPAT
jgi:hypothetical protein